MRERIPLRLFRGPFSLPIFLDLMLPIACNKAAFFDAFTPLLGTGDLTQLELWKGSIFLRYWMQKWMIKSNIIYRLLRISVEKKNNFGKIEFLITEIHLKSLDFVRVNFHKRTLKTHNLFSNPSPYLSAVEKSYPVKKYPWNKSLRSSSLKWKIYP